jgi:hypothetical protein
MNSKPIPKLAALAVLVLCCSTLLSSAALSQCVYPACPSCPTDVPPTTVPWNSGSYLCSLTINGHSCAVKICYCFRETSPGNDDYYIAAVMICDPSCPGGAIDYTALWNQAMDTIFNANPANFPCPPCPSTNRVWREVRTSCVRDHLVQVDPTHQVEVIEPCDGHGYCYTSYYVCCDQQGHRNVTYGWQSFSNYTCDEGCNPLNCPPTY